MGAANAKLFVEEGNREVPLGSAPFIIGRSDGCNLVLKGNGNASRKHAEIRYSDGRYMITDLGSHNGTRVNDQKISFAPSWICRMVPTMFSIWVAVGFIVPAATVAADVLAPWVQARPRFPALNGRWRR